MWAYPKPSAWLYDVEIMGVMSRNELTKDEATLNYALRFGKVTNIRPLYQEGC
jgi:hypothetical protein